MVIINIPSMMIFKIPSIYYLIITFFVIFHYQNYDDITN